MTAPRVVAAQARAVDVVRVAFDSPVELADPTAPTDALNPARYALARRSAPAVDAQIVAVASVSAIAVDLRVDRALTPGASYRVEVAGVANDAGELVAPPDNVASFTGFVPPRPSARRFDLYALMPMINRREDATDDLRRFLACLQEVTDLLLYDIDRFAELFDPDLAPEPTLDLMLGELGNPFAFELAEVDKRRLLNVLVAIYRQKGTADGIVNAVRFFLGLEIQVVAFADETLVLGVSRLDLDWVLGASNSAARYTFDVVAPRVLRAEERARMRQVVEYMAPAHTHLAHILEPTVPPTVAHVELGLSELGDTWLVH